MKQFIFIAGFLSLFLITPGCIRADETPPSESDEEPIIIDEADDLDALFEAPPEDVIAEEEDIDHRSSYETSDKIAVNGSFSATGIVAAGWTGWDFIPDIARGFDGSIGLTSTASLTFDARPAPEFRVYGGLTASFNPLEDGDSWDWDDVSSSYSVLSGSGAWSSPYFNVLYCDYILRDFLFVRLGKHLVSWGQGRLFTIGDLMSDSDETFNARFSMPTLSGLTFIVLTNGALSYRQLVYAGKVDFVLADTLISPALRFNFDEGFKGLLSLKRVMLKTDFLVDAVLHYNEGFQSVTTVAGFFREWTDFRLYGEYRFCRNANGSFTHDAGLVAGVNNPFEAPFDLGVKVMHNFLDFSGTVTLGLSQPLWPYVTLNLGIPIVYGAEGSFAVVNNEDPEKRRIALVLALTLSGGF